MKMKMKSILALLIFGYAASAFGADYQPACPASIDVSQSIKKTPDGWTASVYGGDMVNVKYTLRNAQFSDGDPAKLTWLTPTSDKKARGVHTETWKFDEKPNDGFWISCEYSQTSMALTKRLPDSIKSCTVEYDTSFSDLVVKSVHCQ